MKRTDILKRDNILVEYLLQAKGKENTKSRYEIAKFLTENGFNTKPKAIAPIITKIIKERCLPICSLNSKGYYWAKSKQDILLCIAHLQSRVESLQEHIKHLNNFIME